MCELRLKYDREIQTIVSVTFCDANEQYLKPVGILRDLSCLIGLKPGFKMKIIGN